MSLLFFRFIRLYDNPASKEKKKKEEKKKEGVRRRWREQREAEEVKDSGEKEFIEAYISSLQDRGEFQRQILTFLLYNYTKV